MKCRTTKKSRRVLTFSFTAFLLALLTANELYVNERRLLNDKINLKYRTFDEDSVSDAVTHVATPKLHSSDLDSSPSEPLLPDIEPKTATQPKRPVEEKHNHSCTLQKTCGLLGLTITLLISTVPGTILNTCQSCCLHQLLLGAQTR